MNDILDDPKDKIRYFDYFYQPTPPPSTKSTGANDMPANRFIGGDSKDKNSDAIADEESGGNTIVIILIIVVVIVVIVLAIVFFTLRRTSVTSKDSKTKADQKSVKSLTSLEMDSIKTVNSFTGREDRPKVMKKPTPMPSPAKTGPKTAAKAVPKKKIKK